MQHRQIARARRLRDDRHLRALMFLGGLAALILALAATSHAAMAQNGHVAAAQNGAAPSARFQAPIGHRQPRPQDLPSSVTRSEGAPTAEEQALDRKLEICRNC